MTIYNPRPQWALKLGQPSNTSLGRRQDAMPDESAPPYARPAANGIRLRKANPLNALLPASLDWLGTLPRELRPMALAMMYPRIVNLLAQQWSDYDACHAYFDELLTGRRPNRHGFPADVRREIWTLREHYIGSRLTSIVE
jgi:hypothetical protein